MLNLPFSVVMAGLRSQPGFSGQMAFFLYNESVSPLPKPQKVLPRLLSLRLISSAETRS
ncbi:MAG: hypothetical protein SAJ12_18580 [Jaaginema sp. PMC 1079.18]|nr:hypothetical protein [Jaaginema sp. PMC 1080.18]MEC4852992.1 hypothetical protein [Jaaginema sp. PMC 1079.18]MEC4868809.1 hypothetical protein [Jaaginema sp. PMC 1078.18]